MLMKKPARTPPESVATKATIGRYQIKPPRIKEFEFQTDREDNSVVRERWQLEKNKMKVTCFFKTVITRMVTDNPTQALKRTEIDMGSTHL